MSIRKEDPKMTVAVDQAVELRTVRGAIEATVVAALAAPAGFAVVVILGRISPEALGFYALITLLVGLFGGILTFGGATVATRAAADSGAAINLASVIQTFVMPVAAAAAGGLIGLVPVIREQVPPATLAALAAAVALWTAAQGATTSRLRFGATSLIQSMPTYFQCAFFALFALALPSVFRGHARSAILWSYTCTTGAIGLAYLGWLVWREKGRLVGSLAPPGLFRLALGVQIIVVLGFLFEAGERIAAFAAPGSLVTLGKYFAGVQIAYVVRRLPTIVGQAALPGFAALRGSQRSRDLRERGAVHVGVLAFVLGSALVLMSPAVSVLLGDRYRGTATVVSIVAVACAATATWPLDASYATAEDRLHLYQLSLVTGIAMFVPLVFTQALLVLALCRAASLIAAHAIVITGLRAWTGERRRQLLVTLTLGAFEVGLARVVHAPAFLVGVWLLGLAGYFALLPGVRGTTFERLASAS
jgi:hypothetical protein